MEARNPEDRRKPGPRRRIGYGLLALLSLVVLVALTLREREPQGSAEAPAQRPAQRPLNVLFILTDQLNARTTSLHGNGFGGVQHPLTPSLDRLAAEGARFDAALCATPQCAPSRYTLFTGQWPHTHGLRWNRVWEPRGPVTLATLARDAGYETAHIGKHHMMWLDQPDSEVDLGFSLVVDRGNYKAYCAAQGKEHHAAPRNSWRMPRMKGRLLQTGYTFNTNEFHPSGFFADQVIEFLEARAGENGDGKPFLCWMSTPGPHTPLLPSGPADADDWAHRFHPFSQLGLPPNHERKNPTARLRVQQELMLHISDEEWREVLSYYYGLIAQIDHNVGRVLDRLDELELTRDTLVVFTADHGEMASEMGCWSKGTGSYDAINRVPLVIRLPGQVGAGKVLTQPTTNVDLMPTILELTGIPAPEAVRARIEGRSLANLLTETGSSDWPEGAFSEFGSGVTRHRMVRTSVDKYSFDERGKNGRPEQEYYDLVSDPFEMNNLFDDPAAQPRIEHLRGLLAAWWKDGKGQAPLYEVAGEADALPALASARFPRADAKAMPLDVDLVWLPSTAADRQRVYFGTDEDPPLLRELETMEERCNLGTLEAHTTYYWRVEGVNANGSQPGEIVKFRTGERGEGGPGLATAPRPAHRSKDIPRTTGVVLEWVPAPGASGQTLLVGEDTAATVLAELPPGQSRFELAPSAGVQVHWRIDSTGAAGTTRGDEWTFDTDPGGLPGWASAATPEHLARAVGNGSGHGSGHGSGDRPGELLLTWEPAPGATTYRVYLGTAHPLPLVAKGPETRFTATGLEPGQAYLWRVDAINDAGRRRGWNWRFGY